MRVFLASNALHVGGMETFMFLLAEQLRAAGHAVSFVVTDHVGNWHERPPREGFELITVIPAFWESRQRHARRLARCLADADVVILNHTFAAQAALGLLPATTVAVSVVHNDHDAVYRVALANAAELDALVSISTKTYGESCRRGVSAEKIVCIRHGLPVPPAWPKAAWHPDGERPLEAAFVGRIFNLSKGVFDLIPIVRICHELGAPVRLHVIGDGPDLEELKRRCYRERNGSLPIKFYGVLPYQDTMTLLGNCDVLVMPSRYEGLGLVAIEALALGVIPVVSYLPGITDDILEDGINGFLLPVGDNEAFAHCLAALRDPERRRALSKAAWASAARRFSVERMGRAYLELIENLAAARRAQAVPRSGRLDTVLLGRCCYLPSSVDHTLLYVLRTLKKWLTYPFR